MISVVVELIEKGSSGRWLTILLMVCASWFAGRCEAQRLAVLYPEVREPYRQLFDAIIDGVRDGYRGDVVPHELGKDDSDEQVLSWLQRQRIDAVLALGGRGTAALSQLPAGTPVVLGAVLSSPEGSHWPGISLIPDPRQLFERLLLLQPQVKNVYVVFEPTADLGLAQARIAAASLRLNLVEIRVDGLIAKAQQYRVLLGKMEEGRDALWVAHDGKLLDSALMEQLLETAWQRQLLVFSSSLVDVKRGALFTLFPDNRAMGRQLAQLVVDAQQHPGKLTELTPVSTLQGAINLRTADHLSLPIPASTRQQFSLTFPQAVQ